MFVLVIFLKGEGRVTYVDFMLISFLLHPITDDLGNKKIRFGDLFEIRKYFKLYRCYLSLERSCDHYYVRFYKSRKAANWVKPLFTLGYLFRKNS